MPHVTMKELLEAGVHFGHQTRRWNPKMKPYIYGGRNGIYIIDLHKTLLKIEEAYDFVRNTVAEGGRVLFVGTKKQAQESIQSAAERCQQYYVNQRWLGGMLTNMQTIRQRVQKLRECEEIMESEEWDLLPKAERLNTTALREKLEKYLTGIKDMAGLPSVIFIVDLKKEHLAVREAQKLEIPVVAIVDSNCDPDEATHPIPGNDDAIRAIRLLSNLMADAALEGLQIRDKESAERAAVEAAERQEGLDDEDIATDPGAAEEPTMGYTAAYGDEDDKSEAPAPEVAAPVAPQEGRTLRVEAGPGQPLAGLSKALQEEAMDDEDDV
ncbi:MAG: 30S ribosomal protein S2 [candidate division WS1 bacterium]|jgi:small subunit ribosomal protein S2|nr:30S ribosomal protein S2 [candidate division WS1 bacterium]